ncbi:unnamed protein product [Polarella glacialis]|uniref:Uncharacterized protein n=1 Tax=Polarella glacialis TaxID=89957 RepID=A0A813GXZ9_POLGL|nr:unnamed protein product [Polarella glacialis]
MSFPLYSTALANAVVFCVQGATERLLQETDLCRDRPRVSGFIAGCVAGLVQSPLVCTVDLVKIQRQVQFSAGGSSSSALGPAGLMRQRVAALGVGQGCFQGLALEYIFSSSARFGSQD